MSKKTFKILLTTRHKRVHSGSTIQLYLLAKELVKRGHRVQALVNGERGKPLRDSLLPLEQAGVKVEVAQLTKLKYGYTIPELFWLRNFLAREQFDVINTFAGTDLSNLIPASAGMFIPVLVAYRGLATPLDFFNSIKYRLPKLRKIIANSEAVKEIMVRSGQVPPEKITVIYGGFELERFRPEISGSKVRAEFSVPESAPLITIIGHVKFTPEHRKGGYYFWKAAEKVIEQRPDARFLMVGKVDRAKFEQVASARLKAASIITGFRADIPELLAASDVLVNSSMSEGMAGVIRESLAMAKPVVATEIDGTPELVKPGETGILVPPENPEALAQGILELIGDRTRAAEMGRQGRKLVEKLCDNRERVDKYERLYFEEYDKATRVRHTFWRRAYWKRIMNDKL